MSRKQIVILGGGTGGTMTANRLRRRFEADEAEIHAVDRDDQHVYQPGLLFVPFLIGLPRATALRLLLAAAVYVGGALGLELVNGAVLATERTSPLYLTLVCLEETLEVTGVLLAIYAVAFHLRKELGAPSLRLG